MEKACTYSVTLKQTSGTKGNGSGTVSILDITAGHSKFGGDITATGPPHRWELSS